MLDFIDILPRKLQYLITAVIIVVTLWLLSLLATGIPPAQAHTASSGSSSTVNSSLNSWNSGDSPNVVANGLGAAANALDQTINTAGNAITNGLRSIGTAFSHSGQTVTQGTASFVRGVGSGFAFMGRMLGSGLFFVGRTVGTSLLFVLNIPVHIMGYFFETPVVSAMIRPSDDGKIPTIDANTAGMFSPATLASNNSSHTATSKRSTAVRWPIHGTITTLFGVPEWPYEPIHTGIDISDGAAPGVTKVHAFKTGKVIATIHSNLGLGNHVIVDHGGGMTSVYGHLYSISVHVGQQVDTSTVVGYEGSTGVSTGTHLHFEIRLKGVAVDPQKFITGQP